METESEGRTLLSDVIVGCAMMLLSVVCGFAYVVILTIIWKDGDLMKMASYKLMFTLGVFDVIQCIPHFVTGIFTIRQSVLIPVLAKIMGVLATPAYIAYALLTAVLSINRFVQIYSPHLEDKLFNKSALYLWIGSVTIVWFAFAVLLSSPWATISYLPDLYSWGYDYSLRFSHLVKRSEMTVELCSIFLSTFFYAFTIATLYRTRKRFFTRSSCRAEIKILIQALIITIYSTILNLLWHNSKAFLPANVWSYMALNMMWILNSGIYPLIYFIVNRAIRERIAPHRNAVVTNIPRRSKQSTIVF